jgi:hypothetical protein
MHYIEVYAFVPNYVRNTYAASTETAIQTSYYCSNTQTQLYSTTYTTAAHCANACEDTYGCTYFRVGTSGG